jgi:hypothetical protein
MTLRDLTLKDLQQNSFSPQRMLPLLLLTLDFLHCDVGVSFHLEDVTEFTCTNVWERKVK